MTTLEVLRSSVNTWECDRMGHLNVRHYFGRANEGLATLLLHLGLPPRVLRERGWVLRARDQHVRFNRELRPGAGYSLTAGVTASSPDTLHVYEELLTSSREISATIVSELGLFERDGHGDHAARVPFPATLLKAADHVPAKVPDYAAVRGVTQQPLLVRPARMDAIARGMTGAFLGPVLAEDCDVDGVMREAAHMARISDGIQHFFQALGEGPRPSGIGGAAVEYRYVFHAWPRVNDVIEIRSGLKAVGRKTMTMLHYIYDLEREQCVASSEAVAVWFDLQARKAVEIPPETREHLQTRVIADLSL